MKKTITLFICLFSLSLATWAQDKTVTGKVTSSQDKLGIPGVSILEPGTTNGTVSDIDGKYSIKVKSTTTQLRFSGTGLTTRTVDIPASNSLDLTMQPDVQKIGEVVVTALGIKREEKSLGYSTQKVSGDDLAAAKEANVINSLQGRVAGVSITGSSNMGGSSRILLRGMRSINFENQPLFVVDGIPMNNENVATVDQQRGALGYDYGNAIQDINPDDIESINVLKGPSATALYGSRGSNGVIIITTKKGVAREKSEKYSPIGVTLSTGWSMKKIYNLPKYQNRYGGGASSDFIESDIHPGELRSEFEYDGSWGPELLGQEVYQWDSYVPSMANYNKKTPWVAHPNNVKDFFETGIVKNNSVSLDGGNEKSLFRLGYTNYDEKGVIPNESLNRNIISFNGSNKFNDRLSATLNMNYVVARGKGRAATGYNSIASNFNQWWQRQLDIKELKDYKNPDGSQRAWNMNAEDDPSPLYWDNPYWVSYENYETDQRNRLYGGLTFDYDIGKGLSIAVSGKTDYYNDNRQERVAVGSAVATAIPAYSENSITFNENNYDMILSYKHRLGDDLDFNGFVGVNRVDQKFSNKFVSTQGGLNVPNFYNINNSTSSELIYSSQVRQLRKNSLFASASFGYKSFLYLDVTGRNDWSSTLPEGKNSYFYPSITGSFVFSEKLDFNWLSYGKLRAGWAQTAIDPVPYRSTLTSPSMSDNFNGLPTSVIPGTFNNTDLRPEMTSGFETGLELHFLQKRISLDVAYSSTRSKDVIFNVQQSGASGIDFKIYNAAELTNKTVELMINVIPVKLKNGLEWGVGMNWAKTNNKVVKLFTDELGNETENVQIGTAPFSATLQMRKGMEASQIVGYDFVYDDKGNKVVGADGFYLRSETVKPLGSVLPDYTGGVNTYVSFKGIRLSGLIDFQKGGKVFSLTNVWGKYSGIFAETAEGDIRENGLVNEGVTETGEQNTTVIAAVDHYFQDGGYVITAADVYDASFVKLREMTLSYELPQSLFKKAIRGVSVGVYGRNLAILHKNVPNIDPEAGLSSGNVQGFEGGQLPTARIFGVNLNVRF